jgi:copper oxidase (laccase) domain-containing protein
VEVVEAFERAGHDEGRLARWSVTNRGARPYLDLWTATADQLRDAGVPEAQIHVSRQCTAHAIDRFFSYRREGPGTGRLAAVIRVGAASAL